jgi:site-specific recombinase XerD
LQQAVERSTVNTELKAIKRFFNRAVELGYLKESPTRKVRLLSLARRNPRFFGEGEIALILEDCKDARARELHIFLLSKVLRIREAQNLEWGTWISRRGASSSGPRVTGSRRART